MNQPSIARSIGLALVVVALVASGCAAPGVASTPVAPSPAGPVPAFELALDGTVALPAYVSDAAASLNECAPASTGGWSYLYGGGTPFVTVDLKVYSDGTSGVDPADFDLDVVTPGAVAIRVVPSGRKEGAQGSGTVRVEPQADGGVAIVLDGEAITLQGGPGSLGRTSVHLDLRCPAAD
jgi:hypothetical protein